MTAPSTATAEHLAIAKITGTHLGYEEGHGIFTAQLTVDLGGSGMTIGNYALGTKAPGTAFGTALVKAIIDACGVKCWEDVTGRTVYVVMTEQYGRALGIQNLPTEPGTRVIFSELAETFRS